MNALLNLHDRIFDTVNRLFGPWLIATAARLVFASVLLQFFWNSGKTKLGDSIFELSLGAYAQVFPKKLEALGYDTSMMSGFDTLVVFAGTYAEFILPAMVVIGLFTRLASIGMIGFIGVMTLVDITGHGLDAATIGVMFDRLPYGLIADQRLLWIFVLVVPIIYGAGPISADYLLKKLKK